MKKMYVLLSAAILLTVLHYAYTFSKVPFPKLFSNTTVEDDSYQTDDFSTQLTDINALINQDVDGYIYFGRDTCVSCLTLNELLHELCTENPGLQIYKFDTDVWREDSKFHDVLDMYEVESIPLIIKADGSKVEVFNPAATTELWKDLCSFLDVSSSE